jgi:DNA helicase II / ATP-dependent DNA helicase PcrA
VFNLPYAHLLKQGVRPSTILALTFTNKAAREMKERIAKVVGENMARYLWMGTFHSVFARMLRTEHEILGYPSNFTIYDSSDSKSLIKTIIKSLGLRRENLQTRYCCRTDFDGKKQPDYSKCLCQSS